MEFSQVVTKRRMVRRYRTDPVPRAVVERILDAARRAPSAGFAQGQRFIVVTEPERRSAIGELADESLYRARGFEPWLSDAPVHVVLCVSTSDYEQRYAEADKAGRERWTVPYEFVDAGAALMAILLTAVNEGVAAGFLGAHRLPGIRDLLGIPDEVTPVGLVTIGRPAPDRGSRSLARGRKPPEEVIRWESWAGG